MQALQKDLNETNDQIINDNKNRKDIELKKKMNETFDHFPFTSGDNIEKHRVSIGAQLKSDMQNYMTYAK